MKIYIDYDCRSFQPGEYWIITELNWINNYKVKRIVREFGLSALGLLSFLINENIENNHINSLEDSIFSASFYSTESEMMLKLMVQRMIEIGLIDEG